MSDVERPERFDMSDTDRREDGLAAAALAVRRGELVLLPTDTVYGIGCDAFDPDAVNRLLGAKGRGREMPPPVLISTVTTLDALADDVPEWARVLTDAFWPGPLTLVLHQQTSLQWDLGDARGTVALRMPEHDIALELIQRTGPLAVSSANITGMPAACDADSAIGMLGDEVTAVLDSGLAPGGTASTIVDCTSHTPRVLREGALATSRIREALAKEGHWLEEDDDEGGLGALPAPDEPEVVDGVVLGDEATDEVAEDEHGSLGGDAGTDDGPGARHRAPEVSLEKNAVPDPLTEPVAKHALEAPPVEEVAEDESPARETAARRTTTKKAAVKKTTAKKATAAKKTTATKKATTKKAAVKKAAVKKSAVKKSAAGTTADPGTEQALTPRAPAKRATAKRPPAAKKSTPAETSPVETAPLAPVDPPVDQSPDPSSAPSGPPTGGPVPGA